MFLSVIKATLLSGAPSLVKILKVSSGSTTSWLKMPLGSTVEMILLLSTLITLLLLLLLLLLDGCWLDGNTCSCSASNVWTIRRLLVIIIFVRKHMKIYIKHINVYNYMHAYMFSYKKFCINIYIQTYICIYMDICMYIYIQRCILYIHAYTHIYIYIYTHIYICI
jgi:hypothetical protein